MGAKVAHEVRNPLSAIRALVEVLSEKSTDDRDAQRLSVVLGEVDRIDDILRGYLTLGRPLERIQPEPCDLGQLLRETVALTEARAERGGVVLSAEGGPHTIACDPRRLKEVLLNLVLNAIDHTQPGGRIVLRTDADPNGGAVITVEDSGQGIEPARLAAVGTPFVTGRAGGTGLGLALARQAVEQHGGSLELTSSVGHGTVARVRLPARAPETT